MKRHYEEPHMLAIPKVSEGSLGLCWPDFFDVNDDD